MSDLVISKSKIKEMVKDCNVASDFYQALSDKVVAIVKEAEKRALANKRKTVKPQDI